MKITMNTLNQKWLHLILVLVIVAAGLTGCGIASEVINHEANDQRLLKPGALDSQLTGVYDTYQFKFLDKYKITHQFPRAANHCQYGKLPTLNIKDGYSGEVWNVTDIFEKDGHTWQTSSKPDKPFNIDQYTRPEWQNGTDSNGNPRAAKGFQSMCFETWQGTQHFLSISLNKRKLAIPNIYGFKDGVISHQTIGNNHWDIQKFDYQPYAINSSGRLVESWVLPIADTDYTFIFEFGANQDSLQHPQSHAQMQAIFKHLIESVKIEPIKP